MTRMYDFPAPDDQEPARDERLGALIRASVGSSPGSAVDWNALAGRIGAAVRERRVAPWWSQVALWQRGALPLALAAGLVGALALFGAGGDARGDAGSTSEPIDLVSAVVSGTSSSDAARTYAGAVAESPWLATDAPE